MLDTFPAALLFGSTVKPLSAGEGSANRSALGGVKMCCCCFAVRCITVCACRAAFSDALIFGSNLLFHPRRKALAVIDHPHRNRLAGRIREGAVENTVTASRYVARQISKGSRVGADRPPHRNVHGLGQEDSAPPYEHSRVMMMMILYGEDDAVALNP